MNAFELKTLIGECLQEVLAEQSLLLHEARTICAYCTKDMGPTAASADSHGICPSCFEKEIAKLKGMRAAREPSDPRSALRQPDPDMANYMGDGDRS